MTREKLERLLEDVQSIVGKRTGFVSVGRSWYVNKLMFLGDTTLAEAFESDSVIIVLQFEAKGIEVFSDKHREGLRVTDSGLDRYVVNGKASPVLSMDSWRRCAEFCEQCALNF